MRIKLVETETVYSLEPNLKRLVFPALEKIGFYFDVDVKLPRTNFDVIYMGSYKRDKLSVGVKLEFVTTHVATEEWNDKENKIFGKGTYKSDATLKLIVAGQKYLVGPICTSKPETVVDGILDTIESEDIKFYSGFSTKPGEELYPARNDPNESHTKADWIKLAKEKLNALNNGEISPQQYGSFMNDVLPLEVGWLSYK